MDFLPTCQFQRRTYGGPTEVWLRRGYLRQGGSTLVPGQPIIPTKVLGGSDQVPDVRDNTYE